MDENWLKFKKYPHIGKPLTRKDSNWIRKYVLDPKKVAEHKFTPFIHRVISQRKFRPLKSAKKNSSGKRIRTVRDKKDRHIYFASHLDSIIYGYYSQLISHAYEKYISAKGYGVAAVAYRKIPKEAGEKGNKSNIEFAFEAFSFIQENKHRKLSIIVADVTSFFDNLDHQVLKVQWKKVLEVQDLPKDHYTIFKSLTAKKFVHENELFHQFKHKLMVERFKPNDTSQTELKRKQVSKIYHMRHENVVAFCTSEEFYKEAVGLIHSDKPRNRKVRKLKGMKELKGIPQGTPLSATLANVYMLNFDERVYSAANNEGRNAFYQRYSDDLIVICDQEDEEYFTKMIQEEIVEEAKLEIQSEKTNTYRYSLNSNGEFKGGIVDNGKVTPNKQLEYLGFTFDGTKVRVKSAGFSKFYRNMKRSFRRGVHFAKKAHIPSNSLFETKLYKRFTHLGAKRKIRWLPDPNSASGYSRSEVYDWGNFLSYLDKANHVMKKINGDDTIANQYKNVWKKFHQVKFDAYQEIGKNIETESDELE